MLDITIAIPAYNSAESLPFVLDQLQLQKSVEKLNWEIIVIDNNSTDETLQVVQEYQIKLNNIVNVEYFFEAQQGAAYARMRAIQEAKGELVGFLDDDNIPDLNWVSQAVQFSKNYPKAGAYGSQIRAEFEGEPPKNIEKIIGCFAIRERGDSPNLYQPKVMSLPPSAGLVVRKKVWQESFTHSPTFVGRIGNSMVTGEDLEVLIYIHQAGWEIWYNPAMKIVHKIPKQRLSNEYLLSLVKGSYLAIFPLKMLITEDWKKPFLLCKTILGNLYRAGKHWLTYRKEFKNDIILECELQIYLTRVSSVLYYLKKTFGV